jgi:hypothetical protein
VANASLDSADRDQRASEAARKSVQRLTEEIGPDQSGLDAAEVDRECDRAGTCDHHESGGEQGIENLAGGSDPLLFFAGGILPGPGIDARDGAAATG